MSLSPVVESLSSNTEQNLSSYVTIQKSADESSSQINHVNIRFTIALAVPVGKFY